MSKRRIGSVVLSLVILFSVFSLLLESRIYFREFDLPGDIYEYKYDDTDYQIIEGEKTACIVGGKETIYVVKKEQKWRIPFSESSIAKHIEEVDDAIIYVQEYSDSDDYYITIYLKDKNIAVSDNLDSDFITINKEYYGTCVTSPDNEYAIYVNGKEYNIFK